MKQSQFAQALGRLFDETNKFSRSEWSEFLFLYRGIEHGSAQILDWLADKSIPAAHDLNMIWTCVELCKTAATAAPLAAFKEMANQRASSVSPHGSLMLPTVWEYMKRPTFSELSSELAKLSPAEKSKLLEERYPS